MGQEVASVHAVLEEGSTRLGNDWGRLSPVRPSLRSWSIRWSGCFGVSSVLWLSLKTACAMTL
jgi:hypothetical protein